MTRDDARRRMLVRPSTRKEARAFIRQHHRHLREPRVARFWLAVESDGRLCGVCCVENPKARMLDDGFTAEVSRVATDGTRNACSMLLGAAARVWRAMGGRHIITYTLDHESGASLRGAGWRRDGPAGGGEWSSPSRPRRPGKQTGPKVRWSRSLT